MADYEALKAAVISGNVAQVKELTQQALNAGVTPQEVLDQGLIPAMDIVGQKIAAAEFYIPEMLIVALAMQSGLALLKPILAQQEGKCGMEQFLVDMIENPDLVRELIEVTMSHDIRAMQRVIHADGRRPDSNSGEMDPGATQAMEVPPCPQQPLGAHSSSRWRGRPARPSRSSMSAGPAPKPPFPSNI